MKYMTKGNEEVKKAKILEDKMHIACVGDVNSSNNVFVVTAEGCFNSHLEP